MENIDIKSRLYVAELGKYTIFVSEGNSDKVLVYDENNNLFIGKTSNLTYQEVQNNYE